jgi:hypothetical protein
MARLSRIVAGIILAASTSVKADVYLFNDSGRTLIPSDQVVTDNGKKVASLPRQTYVKLDLEPGTHVLRPKPYLWKQQVSLDVVPGRDYYVVVAYKPERSEAWPLAGAPLVLREITAAEAEPLLRGLKPRRTLGNWHTVPKGPVLTPHAAVRSARRSRQS